MSATKDKSQGPYTVTKKGLTWATVSGPGIETEQFIDGTTARVFAGKLNAAYSAGQADRDELVKALRDFIKEARFKESVAGGLGHLEQVTLSAEALLSRYPNP